MSNLQKRCSKCKIFKPHKEFVKCYKRKSGIGAYCLICHKERSKRYRELNKERVKAYDKVCYRRYKNEQRDYQLQHKYGITLAEYDRMFIVQDGTCAICGGINIGGNRLCVDHNHKTGQVRSLLCHGCNGKLGAIEDTKFVKAARVYLVRHNV